MTVKSLKWNENSRYELVIFKSAVWKKKPIQKTISDYCIQKKNNNKNMSKYRFELWTETYNLFFQFNYVKEYF